MARLLGQEFENGRWNRYWLHTGEDARDRITVETVQDVSPIIKATKLEAQNSRSKDFRLKATIPSTMIDEASRLSGKLWGVSTREAFTELLSGKSARAKRVMKTLTEGRDYRKLQAKYWR